MGVTGKHLHYIVSALSNAVRGDLSDNGTLLPRYCCKSMHFLSENTGREVILSILSAQGENTCRKSKNLNIVALLHHHFYKEQETKSMETIIEPQGTFLNSHPILQFCQYLSSIKNTPSIVDFLSGIQNWHRSLWCLDANYYSYGRS